ncbi:MAG: glutamate-1-semialdehyde 2,1-aminomutase [Lachnospiraceae bacterium]|nr:glutamate-1-semialdehyde 2,1-aminomutase [Lachnospiraceae bacterium]
MISSAKSSACFAEAKKYIPGGVNSPVRAFRSVGLDPRFIRKGKGSRIYDIDGNEYIDYVCSWGPCILGHAYPPVINAVKEVCENGLTFGAPTERETELARLIIEAVPAIDRVRLVSSGTEAVMSAIRVARGFTKRNKIIKFTGNYHGHSDGLLVKAGSGLLTESIPDSGGVPEGYVAYTLLADYNNEDSVKALFDAEKDDIAALIVEPVAANMGVVPPKPGFLEFLRDITEKNGSLLIFDEVITGFRLSYGGAGEYFGVKPDMVTLGKIVGGGMPLAAYGGRADVMGVIAPEGPVYQAGTLSGNPVAVTAGIETLKALKDNKELYESIDRKAAVLEKAFRDSGRTVNRVGSLLSAFFTDKEVTNYATALSSDTKAFASYFGRMLEEGIYVAPSQFEAMFVSAAHTDEDIERTAKAIQVCAK